MKKNWNNPELKELELSRTNEEERCEDQETYNEDAKCFFTCKYGQNIKNCTYRVKKGEIFGIPVYVCTYKCPPTNPS